ncbi:hypothetical protein WA588_006006, partial [Blastocystis sp. NMH]
VSSLGVLLFVLYCVFYRSLPGGYIIKVISTCIRSLFQPRLRHVFDDSEITYRVWFCDIDNYGHMNNSCYNLYCDYGRYNCAIRLFGIKALRSAYCVVGTADIQYIRSMKLFQKFVLRTSVVAVSGKNVMFRQVFESNGKVYAIAMMRMVFLDSHYRTVLGKDVFAEIAPSLCNDVNWDEDRCSAPHHKELADQYISLNEGIKDSLEADYKDKLIPLQIR